VDWYLTGLAVFLVSYSWSVLDTAISPAGRDLLEVLLTGIWVLFGLDYLIRLWLAERKLRFIGTHLLDLAILLLPMFRQQRALRVITVIGVLNRQLRDDVRGRVALYVASTVALSASSPRWRCWTPSATPRTRRSPPSRTRSGGR
jgi:voltage-gated potassium channel